MGQEHWPARPTKDTFGSAVTVSNENRCGKLVANQEHAYAFRRNGVRLVVSGGTNSKKHSKFYLPLAEEGREERRACTDFTEANSVLVAYKKEFDAFPDEEKFLRRTKGLCWKPSFPDENVHVLLAAERSDVRRTCADLPEAKAVFFFQKSLCRTTGAIPHEGISTKAKEVAYSGRERAA